MTIHNSFTGRDGCCWQEINEDAGLRDMCNYGVERRKKDEVLKFNCFSKDEVDFINGFMRRIHPDIPFFCTWITFKEPDRG